MKEKLKKLSKAFEKQAEGLDGIIDALTRTAPTPTTPTYSKFILTDDTEVTANITGEITGYPDGYSSGQVKSIELGTHVTSIGDQAFCESYELTSVTIPNSVTAIGDEAFAWTSDIKTITLGNNVETIGVRAF